MSGAYVPPSNIEAEQAILGGLLYDNSLLESACSGIKARHFYDPVHGLIYSVLATMIENRRIADAITVREHFKREGALAEIGGAEYLITLCECAARIEAHAADYAKIILDMAMRRAALTELEATRASLLGDLAGPATDTLLSLERKLGAFAAAGADDDGEDISLRDAAINALDKYGAGGRGIPSGLATIDAMIGGLFPEDLVILAGRPSMGKSSLADNISHAVAQTGSVVAVWSGEMGPEQIAERALSRASYETSQRFMYRSFRRRLLPEAHARALIGELPQTLIINKRGAITLDRLRAFLRRVKRQHKGRLDLAVVDYLQLMTSEQIKFGETAQVSAITAGLKALAKDFEIPVVALSQLSRDVERREDKRPKLADLRQSGSIEQDADVVLFVYREAYYLERDEPRATSGESRDEFDLRHAKWAARMIETRGKVELIAGKARHDAIGVQWLDVDLGYDVVADPRSPGDRRS